MHSIHSIISPMLIPNPHKIRIIHRFSLKHAFQSRLPSWFTCCSSSIMMSYFVLLESSIIRLGMLMLMLMLMMLGVGGGGTAAAVRGRWFDIIIGKRNILRTSDTRPREHGAGESGHGGEGSVVV